MITTEEILQRYRQADPERRLAYFLQYRELRDRFHDLDQTSPGGERDCHDPARRLRSWTLNCLRTRLTITLEGR